MLGELVTAFTLGLATPVTAACVLPLYPGFIAYLARTDEETNPATLGAIVMTGVITAMFLVGLVFTYGLKASLTEVIGIVSPIMFTILVLVSVLLIVGFDFATVLPSIDAPRVGGTRSEAFLFGMFFGGIALPCNPGMITALFSFGLLSTTFATTFLQFLTFGIGLGLPLFALAIAGEQSNTFISYLTRYKRTIDVTTGTVMLAVSLYYLIVVFNVI